jgi:lysozyme family protein
LQLDDDSLAVSLARLRHSENAAMTFQACLPVILKSEGGFVNDPRDERRATNLGITIDTLSDWLGRSATVEDIKALTPAAVAPIYKQNYYDAAHAGDCPAGVDLMVFDAAVNQGVGRAVRSLQRSAGVTADGAFGPNTQAAVNAMAPDALINAIAADREAYYRSLPTFPRFGKGWLARVARTTADALAMAAPA